MQLLIKIINALITVINIIFMLLKLYSHKWLIIILAISALINTVLLVYGATKLIRKWFVNKKTENKETQGELNNELEN